MRLLSLNIGQLSAATGITAKALRHYEALGLLPPVARKGHYRQYGAMHIQTARLIRQAQDLGFTLAELRALGKDDCTPDWSRFLLAIAEKRSTLRETMASLTERDAALAALAQALPAIMAHTNNCEEVAAQLINT